MSDSGGERQPKPARKPQLRRSRRQPGGVADELQPYIDRKDAKEIDQLGERLKRERPTPTAGFRTELRARLAGDRATRAEWRPGNLRLLVAAYMGSGLALLAIAAVGLAGAGPLGY